MNPAALCSVSASCKINDTLVIESRIDVNRPPLENTSHASR
jgi:hypothetical protein